MVPRPPIESQPSGGLRARYCGHVLTMPDTAKAMRLRGARALEQAGIRPRVLGIAVFGTLALVGVIVAVQAYGFGWTRLDSDPWNYLGAGERLNSGHELYALQPGDREISLRPPYWSTPLVAPPPIAVLWRPLALLGEPAMVLWGLGCLLAACGAVLYLMHHGAFVGLALLAMPLTLTAISGNFSALLIPMLLVVWACRDRPIVAGSLIAAGIMVKLTPAVFVGWLILTRRWRAAAATVVACLAIGLAALAGAGVDSWADWIRSVPGSAPSPLAISSLTGLPTVVVAGLFAVPILTSLRSDVWGFRLAVVAAALATPALYFQAIGVLAAALVPRKT
jgi:hypothetical protein